MHIDDKPQDQLRQLIDWFRMQAEQEIPAPIGWEVLKEGMRRRALFLEGFTIPAIDSLESNRKPSFLSPQDTTITQRTRPSILAPRPEDEGAKLVPNT